MTKYNNLGQIREMPAMSATTEHKPIVHFVGSIPLPDADLVIPYLGDSNWTVSKRLPDGETGIRKTWIRFLQQVLADNPAIEVASDVPPFKFTQWDGKVLRDIPRLRVKPGAQLDPATVENRLCGHGDRVTGNSSIVSSSRV